MNNQFIEKIGKYQVKQNGALNHNYKKAIQRYRVAQNFGLPFKLRIKVFFRGNGTPKENFEKRDN